MAIRGIISREYKVGHYMITVFKKNAMEYKAKGGTVLASRDCRICDKHEQVHTAIHYVEAGASSDNIIWLCEKCSVKYYLQSKTREKQGMALLKMKGYL